MNSRIMEQVQKNIDTAGQHLFGIFGVDEGDVGFTYTIGNGNRDLPELLLIGNYPQHLAVAILNELGAKQREEGRPLPEGMLDIGWSYPFKIRKASDVAKERFTIQATNYFGHADYDVLQVMICDPKGLYPGDHGCEPRYDVEQP